MEVSAFSECVLYIFFLLGDIRLWHCNLDRISFIWVMKCALLGTFSGGHVYKHTFWASNDISLFDLGHNSRSKVTDVEVSVFSECFLLHLYKIVEGLYFHCRLSVCLSVCMWVCVSDVFLWTKCQPIGWTDLDVVFAVFQLSYVRSKWNSVCHFDIPFVNLFLNFIKIEWVMTSLWRHLSFLQTIVHISNSIEPTNFVLGTNTQQHNVHLMIKLKVTLMDNEVHRQRS